MPTLFSVFSPTEQGKTSRFSSPLLKQAAFQRHSVTLEAKISFKYYYRYPARRGLTAGYYFHAMNLPTPHFRAVQV
jgi:hypothetical protein